MYQWKQICLWVWAMNVSSLLWTMLLPVKSPEALATWSKEAIFLHFYLFIYFIIFVTIIVIYDLWLGRKCCNIVIGLQKNIIFWILYGNNLEKDLTIKKFPPRISQPYDKPTRNLANSNFVTTCHFLGKQISKKISLM